MPAAPTLPLPALRLPQLRPARLCLSRPAPALPSRPAPLRLPALPSLPAFLRAPAPLRLPRAPAPAKAPALPRLRNCFFARGEPAGVPFGETARGLFGVMSVRTLRTEKRFFSKKCIRWQHLSPHGNKNPCSKIDKP
ncbi:hypothetical protein DW651_13685 [Subdoligranulum sp. AM23-21AC]|nr:hypothetical protein DW651_13685 [Subdoligranulum sp. AM23-21AC]RJW28557.1 hypothetical protein DXC43_12600 [Subdoligranulum sp. TF05-17AC]